jgi:catalase
MSSSYASLNFDGQMRVDANHAGNPQYAPNSFVNKFRPDTAEAPYQVADSTVSRKSHFWHEGSPTEYEQPRVLYEKVMDNKARNHLHANTASALKKVDFPVIQVKYLAQLFNVSPQYAKAVFELLPKPSFSFREVEQTARGADTIGKEQKFCPSAKTDKLVGKCPAGKVYTA